MDQLKIYERFDPHSHNLEDLDIINLIMLSLHWYEAVAT